MMMMGMMSRVDDAIMKVAGKKGRRYRKGVK